MFQNLSQGAVVSLFYRNEPRVADGRVIAVNPHIPTFNPNQPMSMLNGMVTDITIQVGNETIPISGLPANGVVANFPEKGLFISTDRAAVNREVQSMASALEQDLAQTSAKQKMLDELRAIDAKSNPEKRLQEQQAREFEVLRTQVGEMTSRFDQVVNLLSAKFGDIPKKEE